ncbi:hypothetical protein VSU16_14835 (plasmid) [Cetobacterium somerae]|uniref:hypothetical protein n=1 Tax=Cetobacterium somerae TaxID=188913 RepID=UPI002E7C2A46|nr:hypothetical protein [Cetobacterium somerae]WVJ03004.1 hypothetical protein VSU16_14835 [Cetobacterium somerae]
MYGNNILAEEILKRVTKKDLKYLELLGNNIFTVDDLVEITKNHRNTVNKIINGLYKSCLVNCTQSNEEKNKKFYSVTKFGLSILKNKEMK